MRKPPGGVMHDITARTKGEDGGSLASAGTQVPGEAAINRAPASTLTLTTCSVRFAARLRRSVWQPNSYTL